MASVEICRLVCGNFRELAKVSDMQRVYMSVHMMAECHVGCGMLWTHAEGPTLFPIVSVSMRERQWRCTYWPRSRGKTFRIDHKCMHLRNGTIGLP